MVERMLQDYANAYGSSSVALRYFNAAGAEPDNEIGECHDSETHLVPLVMMAAFNAAKPVTTCGTDYETPDGTCVRDYTHVTDLASANVRAPDHTGRVEGSAAFNLGKGRGHSVREIIEAVLRLSNLAVATRTGPRRPGDPASLVAVAEKVRGILGWEPGIRISAGACRRLGSG
jgi:UDP-glucose 4-epimerase